MELAGERPLVLTGWLKHLLLLENDAHDGMRLQLARGWEEGQPLKLLLRQWQWEPHPPSLEPLLQGQWL